MTRSKNYIKIMYVIPGFRHKITYRPYKAIAAILKKEGYHPVLVPIPWRETTITQNAYYLLKKYKICDCRKDKETKIYILGFSFGAMIALLAATKVRVSGLILCSLSPYFKEDLPKIAQSRVGDARQRDFSKLRCGVIARSLKARQVFMLYGMKEAASLIRRVKRTYRYIPLRKKFLIAIDGTDHTIGKTSYLQKITVAARTLD